MAATRNSIRTKDSSQYPKNDTAPHILQLIPDSNHLKIDNYSAPHANTSPMSVVSATFIYGARNRFAGPLFYNQSNLTGLQRVCHGEHTPAQASATRCILGCPTVHPAACCPIQFWVMFISIKYVELRLAGSVSVVCSGRRGGRRMRRRKQATVKILATVVRLIA